MDTSVRHLPAAHRGDVIAVRSQNLPNIKSIAPTDGASVVTKRGVELDSASCRSKVLLGCKGERHEGDWKMKLRPPRTERGSCIKWTPRPSRERGT